MRAQNSKNFTETAPSKRKQCLELPIFILCEYISWHIMAFILMPMPCPYCLPAHKVLSTLEKPRESASAPTLEAAMPETSHRSSVSSRNPIL